MDWTILALITAHTAVMTALVLTALLIV